MVITDLGNDTYSVYIEEADMELLRRRPDDADNTLCSLIIQRISRALNISGFKFLKAELFEGREDALVFVSINRGAPVYFAFDGFEALIDAASCCNMDAGSSLTLLDGRYILTLYPEKAAGRICIPYELGEFGDMLTYPPEYDLFIKEHGEVIIASGALGQLKKVFCRR